MARKTIKNPTAVEIGRLGGIAAAKKLTPKQRRDRARRGGLARMRQATAK